MGGILISLFILWRWMDIAKAQVSAWGAHTNTHTHTHTHPFQAPVLMPPESTLPPHTVVTVLRHTGLCLHAARHRPLLPTPIYSIDTRIAFAVLGACAA